MLKEGINTVIVGKPNAGKSSLLNILVGQEKAIVTEIAGTTRDMIEESIRLSGIGLNIIDTAGIRHTNDKVEQIGVERAKEVAIDADLIIYVVDSSVPLDKNDKEIMNLIKGKKVIATDLRGGASLLIAALIAEGTTEIESCEYILRGYSDVVEKLQNVGAKIKITE